MARKKQRDHKRKGRKLSIAQARVYRAGVAHGKVLAARSLSRRRKLAAQKAAVTRAARPKIAKPERVEVTVGVDELLLYEAPSYEGVPILSGLDFAEWVDRSFWHVNVELLIEGKVVASELVVIAAEWDQEPAAKLIRREVRSWYEAQIEAHPTWRESPAATLIRLGLRRAG